MIRAIIFKHPEAPGLRLFSDVQAAINAGENPASLVSVADGLVKWPPSLGQFPDTATLAQWEAERVAFQVPSNMETLPKKEQAALIAAELAAGANPAQAKNLAKARFQQAMGLV